MKDWRGGLYVFPSGVGVCYKVVHHTLCESEASDTQLKGHVQYPYCKMEDEARWV